MRIVLVVPAFPKLSETFIVSKFLGLLERGHDVHILCRQSEAREWKNFPQLLHGQGLRQRVHKAWPIEPRFLLPLLLPVRLFSALLANPKSTALFLKQGWRRFGSDVLRLFYLDADFLVLRPDIVHFEFGALALGRLYIRDVVDCRTVVSFRGYDLNFTGLDRKGFYDEVWQMADGIHFLGADLWRRAQRRGCTHEKLHAIISPAIEVDFFSKPHDAKQKLEPVGTPQRPLRLLSVGRLEWKKGYEFSLEAVRRLLDAGIAVEFRIIGQGEHAEAISYCCHQLGLGKQVVLLGALTREGVREQMAWADVFVHAAVSEGFCNAVIEAQAMELPVVTTDADGLPENVAPGISGFVVRRRDALQIAEEIARLASDAELRQRLGIAGRERVRKLFQLTDQIDSFEAFYRKVMSSPQTVDQPPTSSIHRTERAASCK